MLAGALERYYTLVKDRLSLDATPPRPTRTRGLVIVPLGGVDAVAVSALDAAYALGDEVVVVAVFDAQAKAESMRADWARWDPGARLDIIDSPQHALVHPVIDYVEQIPHDDRPVTVLIPQVEPRHSRYRVLENQRGFLMAGLLSSHTDAIVCLLKLELDL